MRNLLLSTALDPNLKNYIYSAYGCYPPWMMDEKDNKICEIGLESKEIDPKLFEKVWKDLHELTDY